MTVIEKYSFLWYIIHIYAMIVTKSSARIIENTVAQTGQNLFSLSLIARSFPANCW